jgi:hypothetical protein
MKPRNPASLDGSRSLGPGLMTWKRAGGDGPVGAPRAWVHAVAATRQKTTHTLSRTLIAMGCTVAEYRKDRVERPCIEGTDASVMRACR